MLSIHENLDYELQLWGRVSSAIAFNSSFSKLILLKLIKAMEKWLPER